MGERVRARREHNPDGIWGGQTGPGGQTEAGTRREKEVGQDRRGGLDRDRGRQEQRPDVGSCDFFEKKPS